MATVKQPKFRKSLNEKQIDILTLLYKFRFASSKLIASYENQKHHRVVQARLRVLLDQEYIGRHYNNSYKLAGKPAVYYLRTNGIKILEQQAGVNTDVLKRMYRDKYASERFINHSLKIFAVCGQLRSQHNYKEGAGEIKCFTKTGLTSYGYFPDPLPDIYVKYLEDSNKNSANALKHYFVDIIEGNVPFFVHEKRIDSYIAYDELGDWERTNTKLPTVLLVCDSVKLKARIDEYIEQAQDRALFSNIKLRTQVLTA
jgi:hypothetical protein